MICMKGEPYPIGDPIGDTDGIRIRVSHRETHRLPLFCPLCTYNVPPFSYQMTRKRRPHPPRLRPNATARRPVAPTVALLFLTMGDHHHPDLWRAFLQNNRHRYHVFCHPYLPTGSRDKTPDGAAAIAPSSFLHGRVIKRRAHTQWGHLVNAYHALFRAAYDAVPKSCVRFVLLSDQCVPLVSGDAAYRTLVREPGVTWMDAPRPTDDTDRYDGKSKRIDGKPVAPRLRRAQVDRTHFFKHSGWFAPCRTDVARLLRFPDAFRALHYVSAGDEHVLSILKRPACGSGATLKHRPVTYAEWDYDGNAAWVQQEHAMWVQHDAATDAKVRARIRKRIVAYRQEGRKYWHPRAWTEVVTPEDVAMTRGTGCLFVRKIAPSCDVTALAVGEGTHDEG